MKSVVIIIGARPNFMKAFPVYEALKDDFKLTLIHTGQHFDEKMSKVFFEQLKFPRPDIHLSLEKKTKAGDYDDRLYVNNKDFLANKDNAIKELINYTEDLGQLGEIRDKLLIEFDLLVPDLVIVFGDVTSTLAAGLAAKKLKIELAHVESGLRSWDMAMPEEVNRILTDHITKYYFVTEQSGVDNLKKEGKTDNVYLVGNTMIDTQKKYLQQALATKYNETLRVKSKEYVLITLHRPSNVDDHSKLKEIFDDFEELSKKETLVYPIHPRTRNNLEKIGYLDKVKANKNIVLCEPLGYLEFTCLMANSKYVVTDSGGIQEETTALDIPCFTLRENTERPSTFIENFGTNQLISKISDIELKECKGSMVLWNGFSSNNLKNILFALKKYKVNYDLNFDLLLERPVIDIDLSESTKYLKNKTVLVTGGGGSIGSEIVIQLLTYNIQNIIVIDNCEQNLFNIENEVRNRFSDSKVRFFLKNINDTKSIIDIYYLYKPNVVFHAAAYKHVPMLEENPHEAIKVNILGTKNIVDISYDFGIEKFLFVSTDKSVNPKNVMGVSKRIAELYVHQKNELKKTEFIITRFGNVLGSSGSVIPTFIKNIKENKNLKVTHKNITRFFMTIPEACKLVLKAIEVGKGGNTLLFDMGEPVSIHRLAKKILNFFPESKSCIEITSLRKGEKLNEELRYTKEEVIETNEKKIMLLTNFDMVEDLVKKVNYLLSNYETMSNDELKRNLKLIISEYNYSN
tara:strand:+ start:661 stop:2889 length:2229 start_codon:yes stop_codon:yes gene_type:complete